MSLFEFIKGSDQWLNKEAPHNHSIISTRARYARNLKGIPFAPRAKSDQLAEIASRVDEAISGNPFFNEFRRLSISEIHSLYRLYLKESHLVSTEFEKGGEHRILYISPDYRISIMTNEEDHIRIQCLDGGFQPRKVLALCDEVEAQLDKALHFARSRRFGALTACPTNLGTGLRLSVMLHLPALVIIDQLEGIVENVHQYGLTVRGAYGEHSAHVGDFFQLSNEVTLGKDTEEIREMLESMAEQIMEREMAARDALFEQKQLVVDDLIGRALATLKNARILDSTEAMTHLSKIRLGIDHGYFSSLTHEALSHLMVEIQPAHLQCREGGQIPADRRDSVRARLLNQRLHQISFN